MEYAHRLLLSTGLTAEAALGIASGQLEPPAFALRAGWDLTKDRP
jgi:hypothetical protein